MPFIDCKLTLKLSEEKREAVKAELGRAVSLLRKSERYLMVGFAEGYELYMAGKKLEKGAYVSRQPFRKRVLFRLRKNDGGDLRGF